MPKDGKHYVTVFVGARVKEGQEPEVSLFVV
jgi:8-oxo-dGTP diphosphatase